MASQAWKVLIITCTFFTITVLFTIMSPLTRSLWTVASVGIVVSAGSIADIDHIVLFMQENRAFDHYFGTMAGIRGFSDPNVQVNDGKPLWYQKVNSTLTNATDALLPWYLNYLGGHWVEATQCIEAGDNGWSANHDALDGGLNDNWPVGNTPWVSKFKGRSSIETCCIHTLRF